MEIKDTGGRREFPGGGVRDMGGGKGRCDLLPAAALLKLAKYYEQGAEKYGINNWRGLPEWTFLDSGMRHLLKHMDGQTDEDHLTAATWNLLSAMWLREKGMGNETVLSKKSCLSCYWYRTIEISGEDVQRCTNQDIYDVACILKGHIKWQPKEAPQCE